jgi:hypothetical protein
MSFLLSPSVSDILYGAGLGYLGISAYLSFKAGSVSVMDPMAYMALFKSDMVPNLLPLLGGYVGYMYGGTMGGSLWTYGGGIVGGALGQAFSPSLRSGN